MGWTRLCRALSYQTGRDLAFLLKATRNHGRCGDRGYRLRNGEAGGARRAGSRGGRLIISHSNRRGRTSGTPGGRWASFEPSGQKQRGLVAMARLSSRNVGGKRP